MLNEIAQTFASHSEAAQQAIVQYSVPILALGSAAALLSEILVRHCPYRDRREEMVADWLDVRPEHVVSIGDGIQLWRDCERHLDETTWGEYMPTGAPSLQGSFLAMKDGALYLLALHDTGRIAVLPDPEDPSLADTLQGIYDHATADVALGLVPLEIDIDCERRAYLVEAIANMTFGYHGRVVPIVLMHDVNQIAPGPDDDRASPGLRATRIEVDPTSPFNDIALPAGAGRFKEGSSLGGLAGWLRQQPSRAAPRSKIRRRAVAFAISLAALIATGPSLTF